MHKKVFYIAIKHNKVNMQATLQKYACNESLPRSRTSS